MGKCSKFRDQSSLTEDRSTLNQILSELNVENVEIQRVGITQLASRALGKAKSYKQAQYGDVAIDRQLKQVRWICRKAMARLKELGIAYTTLLSDCAYQQLLGDLCRYMSVSADIPRIDRAPKPSEIAEHIRWTGLAIEHYEGSKISIPVYTEAIRKMLYAGNKPLTALMLTLRYYGVQLDNNSVKVSQDLPCLEDATIFLQGSCGLSGFFQQFGDFVLSLLTQLRFPAEFRELNRSATNYSSITTLAENTIKEWDRDTRAPIPDDVAYTAIFALIYLGLLLLHKRLPTHLISGALRSSVLFSAAAEIRFRESEFKQRAPFLASLWERPSRLPIGSNQPTAMPISEVYAKLYDYIYVPEPS